MNVPSSACGAYVWIPRWVTWTWREPSGVVSQTSPPLMYEMESAFAAGTAAAQAAATAPPASARVRRCMEGPFWGGGAEGAEGCQEGGNSVTAAAPGGIRDPLNRAIRD